jgi:uncharacterized protein YdhG (YjbR/CyaY superfamily)
VPTRTAAAKTAAPKTVPDYIATAPKDQRAALTKLRQAIKAAAPKATEIISYGMVGYKLGATRVAYFAYWKAHIALYGTSYRFIKAHAAELKPYLRSKDTLQFSSDKPLPYDLVTRIVRARIAEIEKSG